MEKTLGEIILEHSPYTIMENQSVKRYQHYLDTGEYPRGEYSITWDMLAWVDSQKNS